MKMDSTSINDHLKSIGLTLDVPQNIPKLRQLFVQHLLHNKKDYEKRFGGSGMHIPEAEN